MRKLIGLFTLFFVISFLFAPVVSAQNLNPSGEINVVLEKDEVHDGDYFAAGDTVTIYGTVNGDAYIAGGVVTVDGIINGDLLVAGGQLNIGGEIAQDVRAAGGELKINADIGQNATLLGGNVNVLESTKLPGSLVLAAGNVMVDSEVGRDLVAGVGTLTVSNKVGGDIRTGVGLLTLSPDAQVGGNVTYYSEEEAQISKSASVSGEVVRKTPPVELDRDMSNQLGGTYNLAGKISAFFASLIVGLLILKLFPKYYDQVSEKLVSRPWYSLGIGFAVLVLTPFALILLLITIIGIPLSLISFSVYLIYLYLAKLYVSYFAGTLVLEKAGREMHPGWALALGLVIYYVLTALPMVGGFVAFIVLLFGLGASVATCRGYFK